MAQHSETSRRFLDGRWHLLSADWPDGDIPQHRVDFIFHDGPTGLRGAILSRADGSEIPLQSVAFTGEALRLRMSKASGDTAPDPPLLVMTVVADRFEGGWEMPGMEHIRLKLVRAKAEG
jgi:hypothetical protein